ncbi:translation initiation factor IF-2 [Candidatus Saccharibacteria bacterium]|nr:translation initiation factor IF-2 [Candidatus Saccharibacteria bacterium]
MSTKIEIEDMITVGSLAEKLMIPATKLITELIKNGVMATINERIDFDTAQIVVGELDVDVELVKKESTPAPVRQKKQASEKAQERPPVVAVMGHVDHGKTTLLDAIRTADVAKGEAGGITQHISAYQIVHNKKPITFLDTPGHEAFAALREHGAQLTDLVIIVVAADDGIKPQTLEAIRFARKAGVNMIVAINKIDKEGADSNRVKQQLAENGLQTEDWGGDTITVEVSAKNKEGIDKLLDMVLLVSEVEELRADEDVPASGLIIEAHMEKGRGPVAVALVESGVIHPGDFVVAGGTYARVRNLESPEGQSLKEAKPSSPVVITGFKTVPRFGDEFSQVNDEKEARLQSEKNATGRKADGGRGGVGSSELIRIIDRSNKLNELNVIIKADVQGSIKSVIDSLRAMDTDEVAVRMVGSGIGPVTENDVHLAHSSNAIIYGFNIGMPTSVKQTASRDKVPVRLYKVIYELIEDAKQEMSKLLAPEVVETEMGRLVVKGIFKTTKTEVICGGEVTKGKLLAPSFAKVFREGDLLAEVQITNLKHGPTDTKEVLQGEMCGMNIATETKLDLQEGDRIECFTRETVERNL